MIQVLAEVNGAILSATIDDGTSRITELTLDATAATGPVRLRYPSDGSKVDLTFEPGQLVSRTFVGGNRLQRLLETRNRPDGTPVPCWASPAWSLESA